MMRSASFCLKKLAYFSIFLGICIITNLFSQNTDQLPVGDVAFVGLIDNNRQEIHCTLKNFFFSFQFY